MPSRHQGRSSIVIATRRALVASASVFGLLAAAAQAQTPAPDAPIGRAAGTEATGISEIIVTATRSAQSLQSVPIAVSAFNSADLEKRQITDTAKLVQSIPNTTFTATNFGGSNLAIRGVGMGQSLVPLV